MNSTGDPRPDRGSDPEAPPPQPPVGSFEEAERYALALGARMSFRERLDYAAHLLELARRMRPSSGPSDPAQTL